MSTYFSLRLQVKLSAGKSGCGLWGIYIYISMCVCVCVFLFVYVCIGVLRCAN